MTHKFVWICRSVGNHGMEVGGWVTSECEDLPQGGSIAPHVTLGGEFEREEALGSIPKVKCDNKFLIVCACV